MLYFLKKIFCFVLSDLLITDVLQDDLRPGKGQGHQEDVGQGHLGDHHTGEEVHCDIHHQDDDLVHLGVILPGS